MKPEYFALITVVAGAAIAAAGHKYGSATVLVIGAVTAVFGLLRL